MKATGSGTDTVQEPQTADFSEFAELLFFAYRDFVSEPDSILQEYGFGRAHHRVLHFVARNPGLRVADLLDILQITKQSLARVLKHLVDEGFIEQHTGQLDKRERKLFATPTGNELELRLAAPQQERFIQAFDAVATQTGDPLARDIVRSFLVAMVNPSERARVEALIEAANGADKAARSAKVLDYQPDHAQRAEDTDTDTDAAASSTQSNDPKAISA